VKAPPRRLRHADTKDGRYIPPSRERSAVRAAHILAEAMEDSYRGSDPYFFNGNVADALYHIARSLQRIAEAMEEGKPV